jgi:hypothetical protein
MFDFYDLERDGWIEKAFGVKIIKMLGFQSLASDFGAYDDVINFEGI